MLSDTSVKAVKNLIDNKTLVVEGANGSIGLSVATALSQLNLKPRALLLTTKETPPHSIWSELSNNITHLSSSDKYFFSKRKAIIERSEEPVNIIFAAGYGRPNVFTENPLDVVNANVINLSMYAEIKNIDTFAYSSSSEVYTGCEGSVSETKQLESSPNHPRSIYIESKRLSESIIDKVFSKRVRRAVSYRVALATPPFVLSGDNRVLSDLISSSTKTGSVILNGGKDLVRQYQYGPNAAYKILGSLALGKSTLYNCAGTTVLTLGDLAQMVGKILDRPVQINNNITDNTSPRSVRIDSTRINEESEYLLHLEESLEESLAKMIHHKFSTFNKN